MRIPPPPLIIPTRQGYEIVVGCSVVELTERVNEMSRDDWKVSGSMVIDRTKLYQPMTKRIKVQKKETMIDT